MRSPIIALSKAQGLVAFKKPQKVRGFLKATRYLRGYLDITEGDRLGGCSLRGGAGARREEGERNVAGRSPRPSAEWGVPEPTKANCSQPASPPAREPLCSGSSHHNHQARGRRCLLWRRAGGRAAIPKRVSQRQGWGKPFGPFSERVGRREAARPRWPPALTCGSSLHPSGSELHTGSGSGGPQTGLHFPSVCGRGSRKLPLPSTGFAGGLLISGSFGPFARADWLSWAGRRRGRSCSAASSPSQWERAQWRACASMSAAVSLWGWRVEFGVASAEDVSGRAGARPRWAERWARGWFGSVTWGSLFAGVRLNQSRPLGCLLQRSDRFSWLGTVGIVVLGEEKGLEQNAQQFQKLQFPEFFGGPPHSIIQRMSRAWLCC